ncbi:hypothetical protein [Kamptonema formosum]|uniref:hypothetical protein n=1 Tax=Kamptonema formosum TaxID=331992 RepID=UPI001E4C24A1|nr:hypothetical protein [Oscillatoria sp. PCC 10802]
MPSRSPAPVHLAVTAQAKWIERAPLLSAYALPALRAQNLHCITIRRSWQFLGAPTAAQLWVRERTLALVCSFPCQKGKNF